MVCSEYDNTLPNLETIGIPGIGNDENYCKLANLSKNVELIEMISKQIEQNIDEWLKYSLTQICHAKSIFMGRNP